MAEVLLARSSGIEGFTRHVVVKKIRPSLTKDQAFVQMFLNEARLAAQLHHANIVQVHDIGQEGNEYFFAMEYVHGEDVRRLLTQLARHKEKIPFEHAVTIITAAAVALHHAHEQLGSDRKPLGIVHRDVTPANIIVGYDGNVKVVDFGIAKAVSKSTEDTGAGMLKGKASCMSPEQCTAGAIDRRSDVFALGIVLYELVTTRRLFKAENDFLTMSAIVSGKVPPVRGYRPDLPVELEAIIMKALALKPADRYQTADDMRAALEAFAAKAALRTSTSALATFMKLKFGERPEPWLVDDDEVEMEVTVDFDGSASGLAPPPQESVNELAIPQAVDAAGSSPIMKARTKAITGQPANQRASGTIQKRKKPLTAQIPEVKPPAAADKSRPLRVPPAPAAPRRKPITVQIPEHKSGSVQIAPQDKAAAPNVALTDESSGVPVAVGGQVDESAATLVVAENSPVVKVVLGPEPDARKLLADLPVPANGGQKPMAPLVKQPDAIAPMTARPDGTPIPTRKTPPPGVTPIAKIATPPAGVSKPATPPAGIAKNIPSIKSATPPSGVTKAAASAPATSAEARSSVTGASGKALTPTNNSASGEIAASPATGDDSEDGRESAPSLPPPPAATPLKVATTDDKSNGAAATAAVFPTEARTPSRSPDEWPGGSSSRLPALRRFAKSPTLIAIAGGGVLALVLVIFFATRGHESHPTPAPEPVKVAPSPPVPAPTPVEAPAAAEPEPAAVEPAAQTKPAVKTSPKRVVAKPAPKKKTPVQKPPAKKWDPNALFPQKK